MTAAEAQTALDEFWAMVEKKYGPNRSRLSYEDRKQLWDLEIQFSEAKKSDAAKN